MTTYQITYKSAGRTFRIKIPAKNAYEAAEKLREYVCPKIEKAVELPQNEPDEDKILKDLKDIFKL